MRELSNYDPIRARQVLKWPLREALLAYEHKMRLEASEEHRYQMLMWAPIAANSVKKVKPPKVPAILKER